MANTILIKNDTTSGVVPSSLTEAELAINTADAILFTKNHAGNIVKLGAINDLALTVSGTNTYTATISPTPASISAIQGYRILVKFTNGNTASSSINFNSFGPVNLVKYGATTLVSGDISSGQYLMLVYDGANVQIVDSIPVPSTYAGQSSIITLGTVTTGVWNGSTVGVQWGGTGDASFTTYAPICGGTTSTGALQSTSLGPVGSSLVSGGTSALPTFQYDVGDQTVTAINVDIPSNGTLNISEGIEVGSGFELALESSANLLIENSLVPFDFDYQTNLLAHNFTAPAFSTISMDESLEIASGVEVDLESGSSLLIDNSATGFPVSSNTRQLNSSFTIPGFAVTEVNESFEVESGVELDVESNSELLVNNSTLPPDTLYQTNLLAHNFIIPAFSTSSFEEQLEILANCELDVESNSNIIVTNGLNSFPYRFFGVRVFSLPTETPYLSNNGNYFPTPGTKAIYVECVGGGGQGGGAATSSSTVSVGGGGGSGAYAASWRTGTQVLNPTPYAVGAGGSTGTAGNSGQGGGNTTWNTADIQAWGGSGGGVLAAGTSLIFQAGGSGGSGLGLSIGDFVINGNDGGPGIRLGGGAGNGAGGYGASSVFGGGVGGNITSGAGGSAGTSGGGGNAAGAGGSGASTSGTSAAGGAGANGVIRVWEFG